MSITTKELQLYTPETAIVSEFAGGDVSVSEDGDWAAISRQFNNTDENGANPLTDAGAVDILRLNELGGYDFRQKLVAPSGLRFALDEFGSKVWVAAYGRRLFISARKYSNTLPNAGAVFVFDLDEDKELWIFNQIIEPISSSSAATTEGFNFGWSIMSDYYGKRLISGAPLSIDPSSEGAAFILEEQQGTFNQISELNYSKGFQDPGNINAGHCVAISGNGEVAYVASRLPDNSGIVGTYIESDIGGFPSIESQLLRDGDGALNDKFGVGLKGSDTPGNSIAVDFIGENLFIGAQGKQDPNNSLLSDPGAIFWLVGNVDHNYVFRQTIRAKKIKTDNVQADHGYGFSLSTDRNGRYIVSGAFDDDETLVGSGAVYIHKRGADFSENTLKVKATNPLAIDDNLGQGMTLSYNATHLVLGVPNVDVIASNGGGAYLLEFEDEAILHYENIKELIASQFQGKDNIRIFLEAVMDLVQELEYVAFDLRDLRALDTAEGEQLDGIGEIVDLPRDGKTDEEYRSELGVKISINVSGGQPEVLIGVVASLTQATKVHTQEIFPATFIMHSDGEVIPANLIDLMKKLKPAGVAVQITIDGGETPFVFDGDPDGLGFSDVGFLTEGSFSEVL